MYNISFSLSPALPEMASLQDVFNAFQYDDDDVNDDPSAFFHETFSQLKDTEQPLEQRKTKKSTNAGATLDDFEEAFTVLKSIKAAHEPSSHTSINSFLHYRRGLNNNKRTLEGLMWPEHPETLSSSRLIEPSLAESVKLPQENEILIGSKEIPQLFSEFKGEDETDNQDQTPCEMTQSMILYKALVRASQSIWHRKNPSSSSEIDPHLSHAIARRCSFLLQTVFRRAHLNRRSAVKLLRKFPQNANRDLENVPVNWEDLREAAKQIIGQAALDQDTFVKFKLRLEKLFKKVN